MRWMAPLLIFALGRCVLPPDGLEPAPEEARPPHVERERLRPALPLTPIDRDCNFVSVEAAGITDPDDGRLLFRWVANNGVEGTAFILDQVSDGPAGTPRLASWRISPETDFPEAWARAETAPTPAVLSLLVSDAPAWLDPQPDTSGREAQDLGEVDRPDGGAGPSVVEVRWTFVFGPDPVGCGG